MNNPRCIRIFNDRKSVGRAVMILKNAGFEAYTTEDKFGNLTLRMLGMKPRFRLYVERDKIDEIGKYLAEKIR